MLFLRIRPLPLIPVGLVAGTVSSIGHKAGGVASFLQQQQPPFMKHLSPTQSGETALPKAGPADLLFPPG